MASNNNSISKERFTSIKRKFLVFSIAFFTIILIVGSWAFYLSLKQVIRENLDNELTRMIEIERMKLESSVNSEIAIALKMANSPLIRHHFEDPENKELERQAHREIAGYRKAFAGNTVFWVSDVDKKFYSDDAYAYTVDPKDPNNYWYSMTLNETKKFNFNINYNPELKATKLWINVPVHDDKGKAIGILGTGINLTSFIDAIYKGISSSTDIYFINATGEITGAKKSELVTNKKKLKDEFGNIGDYILEKANSTKGTEIKIFETEIGEVAVGAIPDLDWHIFAVIPHSIDFYKTSMTWLFFIMLAAVALIFVIFNVFIHRMLMPLNKMVSILNQISADWNLTRKLNIERDDEIGIVARCIENFFEKIRGILRNMHFNSDAIASAGEQLSKVSRQLEKGSEETVAHSDTVANTTKQMAANIDLMASGAEQASANAGEVAAAAEEMSVNMNTIASAIEEMSASIRQIASNTVEVRDVASEAKSKATNATEVMGKLGCAAKEIGQVTDVIKKIADKTNLLALNATIEAASAGEAGKGFAVVAGEIKELANQSAQSADDIAQRIEGIQTGTNNAVQVIDEVSDIIVKINHSVEDISNYVDQQTKASNEIASNVAQANSGAKRVAAAISEVAQGANEVSKNANEAALGASDVSGKAVSMNSVAKESLQGAMQINQNSNDLSKIAGELKQTVDQFKV